MNDRRAIGASLALAAAIALGGCGGGAQPASPDQFVAFASDFAGFHDWSSAPATPAPGLPAVPGDGVTVADAGASAADAGNTDGGVHHRPLTVYWNHAPPSGSATFPVGTIIVKETDEADPTQRQVFAMVKRGANFNASGAVGWEWFELENTTAGSVVIKWHGYGPMGTTDTYGGNPHVCNDCHGLARSNDYVWSSAVQLQ
ncbi:MAG TPA: hypothetical protein VHM31_08160 [Polyangia bacterium]|nr:hypothetical protein [Polyangia bacterium]